MSNDEEHDRPRRTMRGWSPFYTVRNEPMPQKTLKFAIFAAPWIAGIIFLWHRPLYLGIFLGVSALFLFLQKPHAVPPRSLLRDEDDEDDEDDVSDVTDEKASDARENG